MRWNQCLKNRPTGRLTQEIFLGLYESYPDLHPYTIWQIAIEQAARERAAVRRYLIQHMRQGGRVSPEDMAFYRLLARHQLRNWILY